ncbi:MAG: HAD family hydrolase [Methylobacterium sp.]|uniref:HAD family hydrolase n=1 Tax=Methylobacterium sp. TaxID=409 RepID=UPI0025EDE2F9|nr:HAD family hydrolase [Methylobacterium sp.]MBX9932882.1 HAD family hydrolase [Methylobacterium sp.]
MSVLRGLLFDKDGTLIDFDRTWGPAAYAVMQVLAEGDRPKLERLMAVSHYIEEERRFLPSSPLIAGSSAAYGPLWAAALGRLPGRAFFSEMDTLFRLEGLRALRPIGDPARIAEELAGMGYDLGIATNDAEASAKAQAEALGIGRFFRFVAGYDSGFGAKPNPGMITAFARSLGVEAARVAMIGDSAYDLIAARSAGAVAIAVLSGPLGDAARSELAPLADHVADSIAELPSLLRTIAAGKRA